MVHSNKNKSKKRRITVWEAWRKMSQSMILEGINPEDEKIRRKTEFFEKRFRAAVLKKAAEGTLDEAVQSPLVDKNLFSLFFYDVLQEISSIFLNDREKISLIGMPVTAKVSDILSISQDGQDLAQHLSPKTQCLGVFPAHILTAFSSQSVANILEGAIRDNSLDEVRKNLSQYSVFVHLDHDNPMIKDEVVTAIILFVTTEEPSASEWTQKSKDWALQREVFSLFGSALSWQRSIPEALLQQCYFEWGAEARERGDYDSVLMINQISVEQNHNGISMIAKKGEEYYGKCSIDSSFAMWPLDILKGILQERDVLIEFKE